MSFRLQNIPASSLKAKIVFLASVRSPFLALLYKNSLLHKIGYRGYQKRKGRSQYTVEAGSTVSHNKCNTLPKLLTFLVMLFEAADSILRSWSAKYGYRCITGTPPDRNDTPLHSGSIYRLLRIERSWETLATPLYKPLRNGKLV